MRELSKRHFDVMVTDYLMPLLNGIELLKRIQAQYPDSPVILVSGQPADCLCVIDPPPFGRIRKPYENGALLAMLQSALQASAAPRPHEIWGWPRRGRMIFSSVSRRPSRHAAHS